MNRDGERHILSYRTLPPPDPDRRKYTFSDWMALAGAILVLLVVCGMIALMVALTRALP